MIPNWLMKLPLNLISSKAKEAGVCPYLLASICWVESNGFVYAVRFEENYRWVSDVDAHARKNNITFDSELNLQKQSFGLTQIMGATARDLGFQGPLPMLYRPEMNLYWGGKYLSRLQKRYNEITDVVSAYNQGTATKVGDEYRNQKYVDKVMKLYSEIKGIDFNGAS